MIFRRKLNYRNITLTAEPSLEMVGVRKRNSEFRYVTWLGAISREHAVRLSPAKPVKLELDAFKINDEIGQAWIDVPRGFGLQGCLVPQGVYVVTIAGEVRVVSFTKYADGN